MSDKEILIGRLTLFLKSVDVYEEYIDGLAKWGSHGNTIDEIADQCIKDECPNSIIDHSFGWHRVSLMDNQPSWGCLHCEFRENYYTLPYEELEPDHTWDDMWER